jgi:putative transposase
MVDLRNTSKICPIHNALIEYGEDRIGVCSKGDERWHREGHREVVALINHYLRGLEALYEGIAEKGFGVLSIDGSPFPLGSTATHETTGVSKSLWGRWRSPDATGSKHCGSRNKAIQNKRISITINNHRGTSGRIG